jgi:hypothetical protein
MNIKLNEIQKLLLSLLMLGVMSILLAWFLIPARTEAQTFNTNAIGTLDVSGSGTVTSNAPNYYGRFFGVGILAHQFIGEGGGLTNLNFAIPTNAAIVWPTAPATRGGAFLLNSNGTIYLLTSAPNGATWAATNKLAP